MEDPKKITPEQAGNVLKDEQKIRKVTRKDIKDNPDRTDLVLGEAWPDESKDPPAPPSPKDPENKDQPKPGEPGAGEPSENGEQKPPATENKCGEGENADSDNDSEPFDIEAWKAEYLETAVQEPNSVLVAREIVKRADEIEAAANAPVPMTDEEVATASYTRLVSMYGKDFVQATKGANQKYFSRTTWNNMGAKKNGWVEVKKEMPEVAGGKK